MRLRWNKGFTMIELLIVVTIIGILATVGLGAAFGQSRRAAKDAKRKADISQLQIALESYRSDRKGYPRGNYAAMLTELVNEGFLVSSDKLEDPAEAGYAYTHSAGACPAGLLCRDFTLCANLLNTPPPTYCVTDQ